MMKVTFETRSQTKYSLCNLLSYQMLIKWFTIIYFPLKQTRIKDWWKNFHQIGHFVFYYAKTMQFLKKNDAS